MKRLLAALMLVVATSSAAGAAHVERTVYHLPYDGQRQYLTVDGVQGNAKYAELRASFDDQVVSSPTGETYEVLPVARTVARNTSPAKRSFLAVRLQNDDGKVVYEHLTPVGVEAIEADVAAAHEQWRVNCHRRGERRTDETEPAPNFHLQVQKQPEPARPIAMATGWLLKSAAILLSLIAGGLGGLCYVISTERTA